jgi:chromosome partitioning protein
MIKVTRVVSFINLKGGVGKTTLAVNIAATLAQDFRIGDRRVHVLLIDLDPQTNATISVISQETWEERQEDGQTLYHLFNDKLEGTSYFDIQKAILPDVGGIKGLDLLPSSLHLVEIQDNIPDIHAKTFVNPVEVLGNEIATVKDNYDYIIIDCPPNLGTITLNGIDISNYYVVPIVPDILSKVGLSLISNRIDNFKSRRRTCSIELAGIVFTKVDYRTNLHKSTMDQIRAEQGSDVFTAELPQRISVAESVIDSKPFITSPTAMRKRDWEEIKNTISSITGEFAKRT